MSSLLWLLPQFTFRRAIRIAWQPLVFRHSKHVTSRRKGIGLYTYEQVKNTTAFQYFGQVVVGTIVAAVGFVILCRQIAVRSEEVRKYGSSEADLRGWITGLVIVVIGLSMAHAGVIFWTRRMVKRIRVAYKLHKSNKQRHHGDR
jgi:hypothetical protein